MSSFITISKPYKLTTPRISKNVSKVYAIRLNNDDAKLIKDVCNKLDTSFSVFIKYCAIEVAKEVKRDTKNGI